MADDPNIPKDTPPHRSLKDKVAGWFAPLVPQGGGTKQKPPDESLGPAQPGEIRPPWIEYPGYGPGDGFWRQTGEAYMALVWEPYYESLSQEEKDAYLKRWQVPEEWWKFHFDPAWRAFMESADED